MKTLNFENGATLVNLYICAKKGFAKHPMTYIKSNIGEDIFVISFILSYNLLVFCLIINGQS